MKENNPVWSYSVPEQYNQLNEQGRAMMLSTVRVRRELLRKYAQVRFENLPQAIQERLWYGYGGRREEQNPLSVNKMIDKFEFHITQAMNNYKGNNLLHALKNIEMARGVLECFNEGDVERHVELEDLIRNFNHWAAVIESWNIQKGISEQNPRNHCPKCGSELSTVFDKDIRAHITYCSNVDCDYHMDRTAEQNPVELCKRCEKRPAGPLGICEVCIKEVHMSTLPPRLKGYFKREQNPTVRPMTPIKVCKWCGEEYRYLKHGGRCPYCGEELAAPVGFGWTSRTKQNPSEEKLWEHEAMRIRTMSRDALIRRIYKMTHPDKLSTFIEVLRSKGMHDLASLASQRLREVSTEEQNPRSNLKGCLANHSTVTSMKKQLKSAGFVIEGDPNDAFTAKNLNTGEVVYKAIRKDVNTWICMYNPAYFSGEELPQSGTQYEQTGGDYKVRDKVESNPNLKVPKGVSSKEIEVGEQVYNKFHAFEPSKIKSVDLPEAKVLVELGNFSSIGYFSDKWRNERKLKQKRHGKKGQHYLHEWRDKIPGIVAFAPDVKNPEYGMLIAWRRCRVTKHGIEDSKK